jgi:uncharacterized membrane protein
VRLLILHILPESWAGAVLWLPELTLFSLVLASFFAVIGMKRSGNDCNLLALICLGYGLVPVLDRFV